MTQNNLYMEDDELRLYVDVQPLTIDALENSKNEAAANAENARQSAESANNALNSMIDYKNRLEIFYAQASDNLNSLLSSATATINNTKDTVLSAIQTLGGTVISNINNKFNEVKNSIQTLGQRYVNQAKEYADAAKDIVDNRVSIDHLNQSKGLETGEVSDDADVLPDIKKYARSTFDRSKFTVVGSPNITNDGIASGFSNTKYVRTSNCDISVLLNHSWSVITPVLSGVTSNVYGTKIMQISAVGFGADGAFGFDGTSRNVSFTINTPSDTDPETRQNNRIRISKQLNTIPDKLQMRADFNYSTGEYSFYYNIFDGNGWQLVGNETPVTTNKQLYDIVYNNIQFAFNRRDNNNANTDVLDLKYTKIIVDGVEVFSGNKTGIDTIKPDDYTVVGTPTISADGILTSYSNTDFIKTGLTISANEFKFRMPFVIKSMIPTGVNSVLVQTSPSTAHIHIDVRNVSGSMWVASYFSDGTTGEYTSPRGSGKSLQLNQLYIVESIYNVSEHTNTVNIYKDGILYDSNTHIVTNALTNWTAITEVAIGKDTYYADIDLNAFKIYVDGNLVYQPCLKIPYTESKTGSKIVGVNYRERVKDMYKQFGYAPYYTLSDTDFTLPQGELYGMIENLRKLIIERTSQVQGD